MTKTAQIIPMQQPQILKHGRIEIKIVLVTAQIAAEFLTFNIANRNKSLRIIGKYVADMVSLAWLFTGDTLKFCTHDDGTIEFIDGQHRMEAIVKSGIAQEFLVISGLAPECKDVLDGGYSRTVADMCHIHGIAYGARLQAASRWLWAIKWGNYSCLKQAISNQAAFGLVLKHPKLATSMQVTGQCAQLRSSLLGTMHYIVSDLIGDAELADRFLTVFKTGAPAYRNDAAHAFFMLQVRAFQQKTHIFTRPSILRGYIQAWNMHATGETIAAKDFRIPETDVEIVGLSRGMI